MSDPYNLQRFIDAQEGVYETALAELEAGRKQSHWMWFIFPQIRGLGFSPTSQFYGITSIEEAHAYLGQPPLGDRLRQCVEAILKWAGERSAEQVLGSIDAMKLKSSLTLFDHADPKGLFERGLLNFFGGDRDELTLALLDREQ